MRIFIVFSFLISTLHGSAQLYINEVMPGNESIIADEAGQYDDWFELYNGGSNAVNLQGYYLTDKFDNQDKFSITSPLIIQPGEYLIFWADEDQSQGPTHTNFKLTASGEALMLTEPNGVTVVDSFSFTSVPENLSYGRLTDGSNTLEILTPSSPGSTNNISSAKTLKPVISLASGQYSGTRTVSITAEPSATIYFTEDGSAPTTSSQVYNSSFTINSTGSIRAIAKRPGYDESFVTTHAYLFNYNSTLPIFFISMDPDDLWSNQEGIYVTGTNGTLGFCDTRTPRNYNQDWEKPAHLKVFVDGNPVTENNIGVKIGGNCKRIKPQKPLDLIFRDEYSDTGDNEFKYKLFPDNDREEFKRLIIRDGNNNIKELFKDAIISRMVRPEFDIDASSAQPAIIFLNGQYIGIQIIREKFDKWRLEYDHEKVQDRDSIDVIKNPGRIAGNFWALERATSGDTDSWHQFVDDARNSNINVESEYQALKARIDYSEMINYVATAHFFGNNDWVPNNQRVWKEKGDNNKWRWCLIDMDNSTRIELVSRDQFDEKVFRYTENEQLSGSNIAYTKMFEHEEFRSEYIQRMNTYIELVFINAKFDPVIDGYFNELLPELPEANALYNDSVSDYTDEMDDQKDYVNQRGAHVKDHMESQFNLGGKFNLSFNVNGSSNGHVALHSNYFEVPNNYTGQYHDNVPILIHAIPDPGYRFSHWQETGNTDAHLYTSFTSNTTRTPVFEPAADLVINEIHYNPSGSSEDPEFIEIYNPDNQSKALEAYQFDKGICFDFPEGAEIGPNEYIILANDKSLYEGNGYQVFEWENSKLDNDGERLHLVNRNGLIIDSLRYNDGGDWPSTADNGFYSLGLLDHTLDNALGTSWDVQSRYATPGAPNQFLPFDTYHLPSDLVINEIHYHPFDSITPAGDTIVSKNYEFIELKNLSNASKSLTGVAFSRGVVYEFPNGTTIPPNGHVVIAEDSLLFFERYNFYPMGVYSGKLSNSGELLWLSDEEGKLLDAVRYDDMFPWDTEADGGFNDYSLALIDATRPNDTHINWKRQCTALQTPLQDNDFGCFTGQSTQGLTISEIHYDPTGGNSLEYVELANFSNAIVQLEGLTFTSGITFTFDNVVLFPASASPANIVVIAQNASAFQNHYGFTAQGTYTGNLANGGETLRLEDFFGNAVDVVSYDNVAPWPLEPSQGTHSLALIDHNLNNNLASSWCIQDNFVSPKQANSFSDNDSDGIIDCEDNCPSLDNSLIGTLCDDGDPCTTGEIYTANCGCSGGTLQDSDGDGVCDTEDQCFGTDDALIGTACNDGDPCTVGEMFNSNCQCTGGTTGDSDGDGICDGLDLCPNFDDNLIGQDCNDGDPCTSGETYSTNCLCEGGTLNDADGDGVCDTVDQCPGADDNLIGQSCNDGDPCTINDKYDTSCNCIGIQSPDSDNDGICNELDQCPDFDDSLIGQPCDDGILCFSGSTWDNNCECTGGQFFDTDNDNICDPLDVCPGFDDNIDVNNNGIPDGCEGCENVIIHQNNPTITQDLSANSSISTNGNIPSNQNIEYTAGNQVVLTTGFEVVQGAVFHAYIAPCSNN